jgi:hypothetical protein
MRPILSTSAEKAQLPITPSSSEEVEGMSCAWAARCGCSECWVWECGCGCASCCGSGLGWLMVPRALFCGSDFLMEGDVLRAGKIR